MLYISKTDCVVCGYPVFLNTVTEVESCKCGPVKVRVSFIDPDIWNSRKVKELNRPFYYPVLRGGFK